MNRKELSPEWLREVRDQNSRAGETGAQERREGASRLAQRLGLKVVERVERRRMRG
jgi:hypothetical protein